MKNLKEPQHNYSILIQFTISKYNETFAIIITNPSVINSE